MLVHAPARPDRRAPRAGCAGRNVAMHHHVALDDDSDVERLFRFINGTALGLVACGGGAFCAAHVGVYKALIEAGLRVRHHGRHLGAAAPWSRAFAMGTAPDDIDAGDRTTSSSPHGAMQPLHAGRATSIARSHATTTASSTRYFGGIDIEDLWIPYFAVSTNLSSYELHRHEPGELLDADPRLGLDPGAAAAGLHAGRRDAGRRLPARQRPDPHDARDEERAQRGRQLSHRPSSSASTSITRRCRRAPSWRGRR